MGPPIFFHHDIAISKSGSLLGLHEAKNSLALGTVFIVYYTCLDLPFYSANDISGSLDTNLLDMAFIFPLLNFRSAPPI